MNTTFPFSQVRLFCMILLVMSSAPLLSNECELNREFEHKLSVTNTAAAFYPTSDFYQTSIDDEDNEEAPSSAWRLQSRYDIWNVFAHNLTSGNPVGLELALKILSSYRPSSVGVYEVTFPRSLLRIMRETIFNNPEHPQYIDVAGVLFNQGNNEEVHRTRAILKEVVNNPYHPKFVTAAWALMTNARKRPGDTTQESTLQKLRNFIDLAPFHSQYCIALDLLRSRSTPKDRAYILSRLCCNFDALKEPHRFLAVSLWWAWRGDHGRDVPHMSIERMSDELRGYCLHKNPNQLDALMSLPGYLPSDENKRITYTRCQK